MGLQRANNRYISPDTKPPPPFDTSQKKIGKRHTTRKVSPEGIGSDIRMIQFFINRAGKNLLAARKKELGKAKRLLQERNRKA